MLESIVTIFVFVFVLCIKKKKVRVKCFLFRVLDSVLTKINRGRPLTCIDAWLYKFKSAAVAKHDLSHACEHPCSEGEGAIIACLCSEY